MHEKKLLKFFKYNVKELMYDNKLITYDELIKTKKDLIEYFYKNLNLKYLLIDCYIIGKDFLEGITISVLINLKKIQKNALFTELNIYLFII